MSLAERAPLDWALDTEAAGRATAFATRRTVLERAAAGFFALTILLIAAYTWLRPDYNWDMVAYMAAAMESRYDDPAALHAETWRQLEAVAQPSKLYEIQRGNPYNVHQFENPADFESQLSMYRVKIAYIAALQWLEPVFGLVRAALLLSILPLLGIGLLALRWLRQLDAMQAGFILAPALVLADLAHMATAVTPDILVSAVSLLALYWLMRGRDLAACLTLLLTVFIRPDNIVFVFALLLTAFAFGWRKLPLLLTFAASLAACVLISKLGHHPGWWAHFYFSCVEMQMNMAGFHPDFSLAAMLRGYVRGVVVALMDNDWPAIYAVALAAWALLHRAGKMRDPRANAVMFALAIGALGKFASFPLPDDRFYFVFTSGMIFVLLTQWRPRFDQILPAPGRAEPLSQGAAR